MTKQHDQTRKPSSLVQKSGLERHWELVTRIMGELVFKYGNLSTIVKCRFYGLKSLFLTKQHTEAKKPRSLEQKSRPERYLELMTIIMGYPFLKYPYFSTVKFPLLGLKSLLLRKYHHQTTRPYLFSRKIGSKDIWNFLLESWVNPS